TILVGLLRDKPLYHAPVVVNGIQSFEILRAIERGKIRFDTHCPDCAAQTTWQNPQQTITTGEEGQAPSPLVVQSHLNIFFSRLTPLELHCARGSWHKAHFAVNVSQVKVDAGRVVMLSLQKFGQLPPLADIAASELDSYGKLIREQDLTELKRATGLAAHGI